MTLSLYMIVCLCNNVGTSPGTSLLLVSCAKLCLIEFANMLMYYEPAKIKNNLSERILAAMKLCISCCFSLMFGLVV